MTTQNFQSIVIVYLKTPAINKAKTNEVLIKDFLHFSHLRAAKSV